MGTPALLDSLHAKGCPEASRLCVGSAPIIFEHGTRIPDGFSDCTLKTFVWLQDREHIPGAVCRRASRPQRSML